MVYLKTFLRHTFIAKKCLGCGSDECPGYGKVSNDSFDGSSDLRDKITETSYPREFSRNFTRTLKPFSGNIPTNADCTKYRYRSINAIIHRINQLVEYVTSKTLNISCTHLIHYIRNKIQTLYYYHNKVLIYVSKRNFNSMDPLIRQVPTNYSKYLNQ